MSGAITEVRHGISAPPSMRKGVMFIEHDPNSNIIRGVYQARKNDLPVCVHPLKVVTGVTAAKAMQAFEKTIGADTNGGAFTVSLPETDGINDGHRVRIFDEGGNAGTANITVDTPGSETIDGSATHTISTNSASQEYEWDEENTNWLLV